VSLKGDPVRVMPLSLTKVVNLSVDNKLMKRYLDNGENFTAEQFKKTRFHAQGKREAHVNLMRQDLNRFPIEITMLTNHSISGKTR
jgi:hypothetical protein